MEFWTPTITHNTFYLTLYESLEFKLDFLFLIQGEWGAKRRKEVETVSKLSTA